MPEITIPADDRYVSYAAAAGQKVFTYDFPILADTDLAVWRRRAGVDTKLTLSTDYTVQGVGLQPGGTVTLVAESLAGDILAIFGDESGERITDFIAQTFLNDEVNAELDRIAQALLDLKREITRSIRLSPTEALTVSLSLPALTDRVNRLLGFSSTGALEARLANGTTWLVLANAGPPAVEAGANGDLAIGTTGILYLKSAGAWAASGINLTGPQGPAGSIGTLPDGTPAAPGLAFGADTNTGLHRPAADTLAIVAGGVIIEQHSATGVEILGATRALTIPEHSSAPATPAAGKVQVYAKTNGRAYIKDSAGREYPLNDLGSSTADGRLTLTSGTPVMTVDTISSNLFYTPFLGNQVAIWNTVESVWDTLTFTEKQIVLSGLTAGLNYDVFGWNNAGAFDTEILAWTNDTTRAAGGVVNRRDGVWVKTSDNSRRLLGTFRAVSATQAEWKLGGVGIGGLAASLGLWQANPAVRVPVRGTIRDNTDSWTYALATWRAANASNLMRATILDGDGTMFAEANYLSLGSPGVASFGNASIGLDSTSAPAANANASWSGFNGSGSPGPVRFAGPIGLGWHFLQALEVRSAGANPITFIGDNGATFLQSALSYEVMA